MDDPREENNSDPSPSSTQPSATLPLVIRVGMKSSDSTVSTTRTLGDDVMKNSVTLDTHVCGHCQSEFVDITEFFGHRLQHKSIQGKNRCELCKTTFLMESLTAEHYRQEHKVDITTHLSIPCADSIGGNNGVGDVIHVDVMPPLTHIMSQDETLPPERIVVATDSVSNGERMDDVTAATVDQQTDTESPPPEGDVCDDAPGEDNAQMLKFRLHREEVEGSKFKYGRYVYSCLRCDYHGYSLSTVISHSNNSHPDGEVSEHAEEHDDDPGENGSVLTVEEYYAMHAKKKASEKNNKIKFKRRRKVPKSDGCNRVYSCHTCEKIFPRARSLRLHMEIHRTERNYLCDECGKAFKSQIRLNAHRKVHREKLFHCSQCDFQSSVNTAIHIHRQFHRDGCVLCHVCGSAYTDKSTLKKHMQVHSLDRPYSCAFEGCTWRFKTQAMCKAHLRAHTSKGKFKCDICGYVFRHKHHLQRHQGNMHIKGAANSDSSINHPVHIEEEAHVQIEESLQIHVEEVPEHHMQHTDAGGNIHVVPVQFVVGTEGTPITYQQVDVSQLNDAGSYDQVLIQTSDDQKHIFSTDQE